MANETMTCFGVKCKSNGCEHIIELAPLGDVKDRNGTMRDFRLPIIAERTLIRCKKCGQRHEYQNSDMLRFERRS